MKQEPGWKAIYDEHQKQPLGNVRMYEVECRKQQMLCQKVGAGKNGWPTIKYFTTSTSDTGEFYTQKTNGMVCDELKVPDNMRNYVLDIAKKVGGEIKASTGEL